MAKRRGSYLANFVFIFVVCVSAGAAFAVGFYYTYGATVNVGAKVPVGLPSLKPVQLAATPSPQLPVATPEPVTAVPDGNAGQTAAEPETPAPKAPESARYRVHVGAFASKDGAEQVVRELQTQGFTAMAVFDDGAYRAQLGVFADKDRAVALAGDVNAKGYSVTVRR